MDPKETTPGEIAKELLRVQEEVTGLSDEAVQDGVSFESPRNQGDAPGQLNEQLSSAKKVIQLLEQMRQSNSEFDQTREDFDTANSDWKADGPVLNLSESRPAESGSEIPETIGRFEVLSLQGQGGFSLVFKARDPKLNRLVALKVPTLDSLLKADSLARFQQESRAVATLSHPNIVPVFEVGNDGPISFIASAFIEGSDLARWVQKHGVLTPDKAAQVVVKIADAIQHAHTRSVIHRDLKPANILVEFTSKTSTDFRVEDVYVADFGLAKVLGEGDLTRTGSVLGTPAFSAPEQLSNDSQSELAGFSRESSDIYSLGAILYYLLTGQPPHESNDLIQLISLVKTRDPVPPSNAPAELSAVCLKALEKSPERRYASAYELASDLERYLNGHPVTAKRVGNFERAARWCRRNPVVASLSLLTTLALLVGTIASVWSARNAQLALQDSRQKYLESKQVIDDYYVKISRDPLFFSPSFRQQKQRLLESAKKHYTEFLAANAGDDELAVDLIETEVYLAMASLEGDEFEKARSGFLNSLIAIDDQTSNTENLRLVMLKAKCLRGLGVIDNKTNSIETAIVQLEKASELLEALLPENLEDDEFAYQLMQTYQALVEYHRSQGQRDQAQTYSSSQQELLEALSTQKELSPTLKNYLAMALGDQSLFFRDNREVSKALECLDRSITISQDLIANEPNPVWFAEIAAGSYYRRGGIHLRKGDLEKANQDAERCFELFEALSIHNRTASFTQSRIGARNLLSICLAESGQRNEALEMRRLNLANARELVRENPEQVDLQVSLAVEMMQHCASLIDLMRLEQAKELSEELEGLLDDVRAKRVRDPMIGGLVIANVGEQGRILHRMQKFEQAIAKFDRAQELAEQSLEADPRSRVLGVLGSIHDNRSYSQIQVRQFEKAIADRRKAKELDQLKPIYQTLALVEVLVRGGKVDEATEMLSQVDAELARKELSPAGYEMRLAFIQGALAVELDHRLNSEAETDRGELNVPAYRELAETHFLKAVELGYFEGNPGKYLGISMRQHLQAIFDLPSIRPILDRQKMLWEKQ